MLSFLPLRHYSCIFAGLSLIAASHAADYQAQFTNDAYLLSGNNQTNCCAHLAELLQDRISFTGSKLYNESVQSYYSGVAQDAAPACIAWPTSAAEVSRIVTTISRLNAGNSSAAPDAPACQFAVRSGGHTPWRGSASIDNGVTIDLSRLDSVELSTDHSIASVGGGSRWGNVYKHLEKYGLTVAGGRVSSVGVGGLILGGGISFFSPRKGFVCDGVESFELVTASGAIENISASNKPDLFKALKGGTNNFGVVTSFNLRTFPSGDFWGGQILYDARSTNAHLEQFTALAENVEYDEYAAVILSFTWLYGRRLVTHHLSYTKTPAASSVPEFLSKLHSIDNPPISNTTRIAPLSSFTDELATQANPTPEPSTVAKQQRSLFITLSYENNFDFAKLFLAIVGETSEKLVENFVPDVVCSTSFQHIPLTMTTKSQHTGGNVLGYDPEHSIVNVLSTISWGSAADDGKVESAFRKLFGAGQDLAREMGVQRQNIYLNYADAEQDPIGGYGEENLAFLRQVSKKYDPEGFFQKALPGGFKLWTNEAR